MIHLPDVADWAVLRIDHSSVTGTSDNVISHVEYVFVKIYKSMCPRLGLTWRATSCKKVKVSSNVREARTTATANRSTNRA